MPDSVGAGGFPNNINIGHEHLDISTGFTYQYAGDVPSNILNWRIIGGSTPTDPSIVGWTSKQAGAEWFNTSERVYKYFDGFVVRTFESTAYIYTRYKTDYFVEDDMATGSQNSSSIIGSLNWFLFNVAGGGSYSVISQSTPGRVGVGRLAATAGGAGNGIVLTPAQIGSFLINLGDSYSFTMILSPAVTDLNTIFRAGMGFQTNLEPPTTGVYFEKGINDTTWHAVSNNGAITNVDTGIPIVAGTFSTFNITKDFSGNTGSIVYSIDGVAVASISTNINAGTAQAFLLSKTNDAAAKSIDIDYFSLRVYGLNRV